MRGTVKGNTQVGIDERVARLRLQLVASDMSRRIGLRIRQRRVEMGLTQKQVAVRMATPDLDKQRLSDWERGHNKPSERYLKELVAALEVPDVSYFYEDPEQPDVLDALGSDGSGPSPETNAAAIAELNERLDRIEGKLDQLLMQERAEPSVGQQIHEAFEEMTSRLGREVGKRPPRSRREADRSPAAPRAVA